MEVCSVCLVGLLDTHNVYRRTPQDNFKYMTVYFYNIEQSTLQLNM